MGFALSGRRFSGWEVEGDMYAMREQARRALAQSGSGLRGPTVGHPPDACNKSDPTWGERTREKLKITSDDDGNRPNGQLSRAETASSRPGSGAPQRFPLAVKRVERDRPRMPTLATDPPLPPRDNRPSQPWSSSCFTTPAIHPC